MSTAVADRITGQDFEKMTAQELLKWGLKEFGSKIALASSFGAEDVVLIHMLSEIELQKRLHHSRIEFDSGALND